MRCQGNVSTARQRALAGGTDLEAPGKAVNLARGRSLYWPLENRCELNGDSTNQTVHGSPL